MPVCQNCEQEWGYKETIKKSFTLTNTIDCPYCRKVQYPSAKSRKRTALITMLSIGLVMGANIVFGPSIYFFILLILLIPLFTMIFPFVLTLSNEEEALW